MGFMTEISILNDRLEEIKANPAQFVQDILDNINRESGRWITGQTTVHLSHHADDARVYLAWHNSFIEAYPKVDSSGEDVRFHFERLMQIKRYVTVCLNETRRIAEAQGVQLKS